SPATSRRRWPTLTTNCWRTARANYGQIPELSGVWGQAETLEACHQQLQDVLEGWILLRVRFGRTLPEIDGILIRVSTEQVSEVA
ncbi:MAG TPA: type II toxin-antitoxin system HicB family antitoxin, partial [Bryobacteraceae bacterium]|nr:type II toxin-antitoxin system HicB family antitoxin [Bryobacteraceae bacterium]